MNSYLTAVAYQRWYRQYQVNQQAFIEQLDGLRIRVDNLPLDMGEEETVYSKNNIEEAIAKIDEALEEAIPRDFSIVGKPISGEEKFSENFKVLVNLMCTICRKSHYFAGIYSQEKERILSRTQ